MPINTPAKRRWCTGCLEFILVIEKLDGSDSQVLANMINNRNLLTLQKDCETAVALVTKSLQDDGLKVRRTFDLRSACASFTESRCPHHGTEPCNCQLIVLLVYGLGAVPVSLVVHGHPSKTEFQLVQDSEQPESSLLEDYLLSLLRVVALLPIETVVGADA